MPRGGGPEAIAEFLLIMLADLKMTGGVEVDGDEVDPAPIAAPAPAPAQTSASGRSARIARSAMAALAASSSEERADLEKMSYSKLFVGVQNCEASVFPTRSKYLLYNNP